MGEREEGQGKHAEARLGVVAEVGEELGVEVGRAEGLEEDLRLRRRAWEGAHEAGGGEGKGREG